MKRILFVHRNFAKISAFSHRGLGVSQFHTANTLRAAGHWTKAASIDRVADVPALVDRWQPTHVVFAAPWIPCEDLAKLAYDHHDVHFTVICHSNLGFLSVDHGAVARLRDLADLMITTHNFSLAGNCQKFVRWACETYQKCRLLPNLYDVSTIRSVAPRPLHGVNIAIPGAMRPLKNMFTAAAACLSIAEQLNQDICVHVTRGRDTGNTINNIRQLMTHRCTLVEHSWMSWTDFRRLLSRMHLVLQPSYTESFNIVVADGVAEGVPAVVSTAIDWLPARWQVDSDDASSIAAAAVDLLHNPHAVAAGQEALRRYVESGTRQWQEWLGA